MRLGLMTGPERGDPARKVPRMLDDARRAEEAGFATVWVPQIPGDFDALIAASLMGQVTSTIEIGTAVVPLQPQHPIALARQALSANAAAQGRLALGLGPSHHWIIEDMLGLPYERPAQVTRDYLDVMEVALRGPGPVDVDNDRFRVHNPLEVTDLTPSVLLAALGPVMLRIAGERTDGTILWMADEKAVATHVVPRLHASGRPGLRVVAGVPVCLCLPSQVDQARERANRILGETGLSPNYQRLLAHGSARDIGDICLAGDEASIEKRIAAFEEAGVTDLSIRLLPIGADRDGLVASKRRTHAFLASLCAR